MKNWLSMFLIGQRIAGETVFRHARFFVETCFFQTCWKSNFRMDLCPPPTRYHPRSLSRRHPGFRARYFFAGSKKAPVHCPSVPSGAPSGWVLEPRLDPFGGKTIEKYLPFPYFYTLFTSE